MRTELQSQTAFKRAESAESAESADTKRVDTAYLLYKKELFLCSSVGKLQEMLSSTPSSILLGEISGIIFPGIFRAIRPELGN